MSAFFSGCFLTWAIVYAVDALKLRRRREGWIAFFSLFMAGVTWAGHLHGAS